MSIFECHSAENRRIGDRDQREGGNDAALLFVLERRFGSLFNRGGFILYVTIFIFIIL